jgi:transcription-repair coupling factor (superfamily II helicase)
VPGAAFAVAHGQMKEKELEEAMLQFIHKEIDVLVCTTIIESGLDIPSANTIIINDADRFGLSQIYQLRGRVGRSKENAYAYLLVSSGSHLTRDAEKRLKALMDFTHLGAGLHLAMHDLKIRGGGNILGFSQTGHISAIGYELYLKMIEQAIAELKGDVWREEINPELHVELPAFLPDTYIADTDIRLNLYRRLSGQRDEEGFDRLVEEIQDRFGPPPQEVDNLLLIMSARLLLGHCRIRRLDVRGRKATLTFAEDTAVTPEQLLDRVNRKPHQFRFLTENKLVVSLTSSDPAKALEEIKEITRALIPQPQEF